MDTLHTVTSAVAWLILLISAVGNIMLIIALVKHFKTSSRGYICLMFNLSVADLVLVFASIPFNFVENLQEPVFPFGASLCKVLWPFQTSTVVTAIFTVVVLSCQRYLMIVKPSDRYQKLTLPAIMSMVALLWIVPIVIAAVPFAYSLELDDNKVCDEIWSNEHKKYFTVYLTGIQYVLPLGVIGWCNVRAVVELKKHEIYRENYVIMDHANLRRHRNVVRMLICIVAVFAIFWFPGQLAWLVLSFSEGSSRWHVLLQISELFMFANSALNPLIFFAYNDEYSFKRFGALKRVRRFWPRRHKQPMISHDAATGSVRIMFSQV